MNFGNAIRGHATLGDEASSGYFNARPYIAARRKGPIVFRRKPKVNTDFIMCSLMDDTQNDRNTLLRRTRGVNHAVNMNYGTQMLTLTSGAQHHPTIPRKLEDEDYRCDHAAYKQEDLVPLSRLPRPVTNIDLNKDVSAYYNKPLSGSDIEASRVKRSIRGNLRDLVDRMTVNAAASQNVQDNEDSARTCAAIHQYAIHDKMASDQLPLNTKGVIVSSRDESNTPSGAKMARLKSQLVHAIQNNKVVRVHETNHLSPELIKKLGAQPAAAGKLITIHEIDHKTPHLNKTISDQPSAAGKLITLYEITDPEFELLKKLRPDARAGNAVKLQSLYCDETDHNQGSESVRMADRVKQDTNVNNIYRLGDIQNIQTSNSIQNHAIDLELRRKNAYCQSINPEQYAGHREQFDRHLNVKGLRDDDEGGRIPYNKGPNFIFMQTGGY